MPLSCRKPEPAFTTACSPDRHRRLSTGHRDEWLANTMPLSGGAHDGTRPVGADGLEYADCAACHLATGQRRTICRRVRCTACNTPVDAVAYCGSACELADSDVRGAL